MQRIYFMLRKATRLYHPPLDFAQVGNMCKKLKVRLTLFNLIVSMTVKKEPGLVLDVEERVHL